MTNAANLTIHYRDSFDVRGGINPVPADADVQIFEGPIVENLPYPHGGDSNGYEPMGRGRLWGAWVRSDLVEDVTSVAWNIAGGKARHTGSFGGDDQGWTLVAHWFANYRGADAGGFRDEGAGDWLEAQARAAIGA